VNKSWASLPETVPESNKADEAVTVEKTIVEIEKLGNTTPFLLLIFSSFDSFQNKRISRLTLQIISCLNQWLACRQSALTRRNPSQHARRYQQVAIFCFVIPAIFVLSYLRVCGRHPAK
jgi:hypothetical protein